MFFNIPDLKELSIQLRRDDDVLSTLDKNVGVPSSFSTCNALLSLLTYYTFPRKQQNTTLVGWTAFWDKVVGEKVSECYRQGIASNNVFSTGSFSCMVHKLLITVLQNKCVFVPLQTSWEKAGLNRLKIHFLFLTLQKF